MSAKEKKNFSVLGWIGMALFALCHTLLSFHILQPGVLYQCLQLVAAFALGFSAFKEKFYPSVGLEAYWSLISLVALYTLLF